MLHSQDYTTSHCMSHLGRQGRPDTDHLVRQGLYVVTDMFPFHLQARKVRRPTLPSTFAQRLTRSQLNIWTMGFIISPFLSPFMMSYLFQWYIWITVRNLMYVLCKDVLIRIYLQTSSLVRAQSFMTQLIFEHALRMRIKADATDAKEPGNAKKGKGSTLQGRITNCTLIDCLRLCSMLTNEQW